MTTIADYLTAEHRACDCLLEPAEDHARAQRWDAAAACVRAFVDALAAHLDKEEQVLFPALEAAAGNGFGPTQVMRGEHDGMRELFDRLQDDIARRDLGDFLGSIDTLTILVGQHNMKEERVLYPMAAQLLDDPHGMVEAMAAHAARIAA